MGLFYGGIAQVIAGILEFKTGNTFGLTAFTSYGFFWITLVSIWYLPSNATVASTNSTFFMFIGTLRANRTLQFVFASLTLLFALLAAGNICGSKIILQIARFEGIICGFSAIYLAMAEVINAQFGRTILPIGEAK